jgi:hypothetical protein
MTRAGGRLRLFRRKGHGAGHAAGCSQAGDVLGAAGCSWVLGAGAGVGAAGASRDLAARFAAGSAGRDGTGHGRRRAEGGDGRLVGPRWGRTSRLARCDVRAGWCWLVLAAATCCRGPTASCAVRPSCAPAARPQSFDASTNVVSVRPCSVSRVPGSAQGVREPSETSRRHVTAPPL